ncbi:phenylacetic acid degradation bifunctional protein PaaZ [Bacteroidia bacterium]|nr:phenylacetic acid degradation bifunctional protein PaaZ [Bacteroidia bacterium]MDC0560573.1 phenylacetic acid degradation bifunctional protein PaaZ [Bacteroidia bacterium]
MKLKNYAEGRWQAHHGDGVAQHHAITGELIGTASSEGLDYEAMAHYARTVGGKALRKMTFYERGYMLKKLALYLTEIKKKYYAISYQSGATKSDSWVDIDGGIGTLFTYASLRRQMGNQRFYVDGDTAKISTNGTFVGQHIMSPKQGVVVHINAFNFPIWGMLEKLSANLLSGVPAIVKPSEMTSYLTQAMVEDIIASGIVPEGAIQLDCGRGHGILDKLTAQDLITFTGSAQTGRMLKSMPHIIEQAIPFNMEADSLNAAILGEDAAPGTPTFDLFIKEVRREMTTKAGQKCTAIRRIIVPEKYLEDTQIALGKSLAKTTLGDPAQEGVRMGALVNRSQMDVVRNRVLELAKNTPIVSGSLDQFDVLGADKSKGAFVPPILMLNDNPMQKLDSHEVECFGPVSTLMPYQDFDQAIELAKMGKGSLVSTIATSDVDTATQYAVEASAYHGRILVLNEESAPESTGHGSPMPQLMHGGPGRAGGGEELGGMGSVKHYLQRTALQGHPSMLTEITQRYQYGGVYKEKDVHPFRKYFEDLEVGDTVITAKHTITTTDIVNFANVSGDNFYAHMDETSLEGTTFEGRVAHGYFVLSKAAGLFVDAKKGPVLLNYGLDECRFTKPVYPGATIGVRFTVKEKINQEKKTEDDVAKGIVKFLVDVYDETGDTVALATILTMVKKRNQEDEL